MSDRFVLLGLARVRSPWFVEVGRWCTSGSLPAQFLKCVSADEVRARLASGRAHSALLVDAHPGNLDRDLFATATRHGCPVVLVADPDLPIDLDELGHGLADKNVVSLIARRQQMQPVEKVGKRLFGRRGNCFGLPTRRVHKYVNLLIFHSIFLTSGVLRAGFRIRVDE